MNFGQIACLFDLLKFLNGPTDSAHCYTKPGINQALHSGCTRGCLSTLILILVFRFRNVSINFIQCLKILIPAKKSGFTNVILFIRRSNREQLANKCA